MTVQYWYSLLTYCTFLKKFTDNISWNIVRKKLFKTMKKKNFQWLKVAIKLFQFYIIKNDLWGAGRRSGRWASEKDGRAAPRPQRSAIGRPLMPSATGEGDKDTGHETRENHGLCAERAVYEARTLVVVQVPLVHARSPSSDLTCTRHFPT